jgi:two-component system, OmpR family, KDP operon response regulator KdpE
VSTRPRILLVDDHPGVLHALGRVLSVECDVVASITDGAEAPAAAISLQPVVIVVDLNLMNASGLDVCRQIARDTTRARVIVISAMVDDHAREEVLAAGGSDFVSKAAIDELVAAVKRTWLEMS